MADKESLEAADEVAQRCLKNGIVGLEQDADPSRPSSDKATPAQAIDGRSPSPGEVVLRCEDRAEEWHFDEAIHKSRLIEHRELSTAWKGRERQAKEQHSRNLEDHEKHIAELLAEAEVEERKCAVELAGLREELVEAQHQIDDLEEECEQQVVALEQEMRAERQRRMLLEEEMAKEAKSVLSATALITEIQDREGELMRSKRSKMAEYRTACSRECLEIQRAADQKISEIGRAAREEIDEIQKKIDHYMKETQRKCDEEVQRRRDVAKDIEKHISETVDAKVSVGLAAVQIKVKEEREMSMEKIKALQARDHEQETYLRERMDAAFESVQSSVQERDEVCMLEKYHKQQLDSAVTILGSDIAANRYSVNSSKSLRNSGKLVLGGLKE